MLRCVELSLATLRTHVSPGVSLRVSHRHRTNLRALLLARLRHDAVPAANEPFVARELAERETAATRPDTNAQVAHRAAWYGVALPHNHSQHCGPNYRCAKPEA